MENGSDQLLFLSSTTQSDLITLFIFNIFLLVTIYIYIKKNLDTQFYLIRGEV